MATLASAAWAVRTPGRIVIVMTHPAFRQPRHAGWGFDESRKLVYRRIDAYLTPMAVPMKALGDHAPTRSFHRPISEYVNGLSALGFGEDQIDALVNGAEPQYRVIRNAPIDVGRDELRSLFRSALCYW